MKHPRRIRIVSSTAGGVRDQLARDAPRARPRRHTGPHKRATRPLPERPAQRAVLRPRGRPDAQQRTPAGHHARPHRRDRTPGDGARQLRRDHDPGRRSPALGHARLPSRSSGRAPPPPSSSPAATRPSLSVEQKLAELDAWPVSSGFGDDRLRVDAAILIADQAIDGAATSTTHAAYPSSRGTLYTCSTPPTTTWPRSSKPQLTAATGELLGRRGSLTSSSSSPPTSG